MGGFEMKKTKLQNRPSQRRKKFRNGQRPKPSNRHELTSENKKRFDLRAKMKHMGTREETRGLRNMLMRN
jgi:hypothetical protein